MRWKARCEALQDRIVSNKEYLTVLDKIQSMLKDKIKSYTDKQSTAKEIVQKLKESGSTVSILIETPDEKRDSC
jgi:predicted ATP-dependent serine protease